MSIKKTTQQYSDIKGNRLADSSMLRMFNILQDDDNQYFMNIFKAFEISDTVLTDTKNFENFGVVDPWWENIAYTYYRDVDAWWVAPLTNNIVNPYEEIDDGQPITMLRQAFIPYIHRDLSRLNAL